MLEMLALAATGIWAGLMALLFVLPFFPGLVDSLVISPNHDRIKPDATHPEWADFPPRYEPNPWGLFTFLEPGQVKIIIRWGGTLIRAIMDHVGWQFVGERHDNDYVPTQQKYWEVKESAEGHSSHPIPFPMPKGMLKRCIWLAYSPVSIIWWVWKRHVYNLTGAVWVGIPYFRTVLIFRFERSKPYDEHYTNVQGKAATRKALKRVWDYSDHLRVADFPFPVIVEEADTQDMVPVRAFFNEVARVKNPVITAFNSDNRWPFLYETAITDAMSGATRSRPVDAVTSALSKETADDLAKEITERLQAAVDYLGIDVRQSQYIDISTVDPKHAEKLADKAIAKVDKDAAILRADGSAAPLKQKGEAVRGHPQAEILLQTQALIETAKELRGSGTTVNLSTPAGADPMQTAIWKALQQKPGAPVT